MHLLILYNNFEQQHVFPSSIVFERRAKIRMVEQLKPLCCHQNELLRAT
ncbi:unnamed protein product [Schistosoma curassoni]|uniref:Uncharacterized protein n=1 Tax=Schistosoma curassoni TaxID=6186 RepID=A0A183KNF4_9TREM|nr:unnamed protein product [Schistosoma curassoni]